MSSNNNPQATAPAPAASAEPQLTASQIQMGGQTIDLKGLTAADAERIYPALPANFQTLANQYGAIAKQFERVADIQLPHGMTLSQAFTNYKNALMGGAGKLSGNADPYLQQMDALCRTMPGYESMVNGLNDARTAASFTGTALGAASDLAASPFRFMEFMATCIGEGTHAVTPGITDAQAKAFGTAYAAALYYEGAQRQTMGTGALIMHYPGSAALATLENVALNVPIVKEVWPYIFAAWKWVSSAISHIGDKSGEKALSFTEALTQAKSEIEQARTQNPDWRSNVEHRAQAADFGSATDRMRAAGNVAGVATAPIADALQNQSTVIDNQGNLQQINRQGANATIEKPPLNGPDGQPLGGTSRGSRIAESGSNILGQTGRDAVSGNLSAGGYAAVAAGAYGLHRVIPGGLIGGPVGAVRAVAGGVANASRGLGAGYLQGTADTLGAIDEGALRGRVGALRSNAFAQSHNMVNGLDRLKLAEEAALERVQALEARAPKGGLGIRDWRASRQLKAAEKAWETAHESLQTAEAAIAKGPAFRGTALASDALQTSNIAADVMGTANMSRLGVAMRGGGRLLGRAAPVLSAGFAVWDTVDGIQYAREGKGREAAESFAGAGSVAGGAAIGAGLGLCGGPFAPLSVPAGAVLGAGIGGLYDLVGGWFGVGPRDLAGKAYDHFTRQPVQAMTAQADPGLAEAAREQTVRTQQAQAQAAGVGRGMTTVKSTQNGSSMSEDSFQLAGMNIPTLTGMKHMIFG